MTTGSSNAEGGGQVLVVDDDPQIRHLIRRFLDRLGYGVETAASVAEAGDRLSKAAFDLVVTDLQMPGASGLDLLAEIRTRWPETRAILMSGQAGAADAAVAIEHGVDRLLLKPFGLDELQAGVEKALAERRAQARRATDPEDLDALLRQREAESKFWVLRSAHALTAAVEAKHPYTAGHAARVTAYALVLADVLGGVDATRFRIACDLHDVGKIGVPDAVLNKPGRLTDEELADVRKHPEAGERILQPLIDDPLVLGVVRSHHEQWDGGGYPDGLRGEAIPRPARILAVADTLDAMTSSRAYRGALSWEVAVAVIRRRAGSQFDPQVVEAFNQALPELEALHKAFGNTGAENVCSAPELLSAAPSVRRAFVPGRNMIRAVYQFMKEGDHEIAARETLNQFTGTHQVADANVHHAPGAVTVIIVDDPPPALSELLRQNGWWEHMIWRREADGGEDEG